MDIYLRDDDSNEPYTGLNHNRANQRHQSESVTATVGVPNDDGERRNLYGSILRE